MMHFPRSACLDINFTLLAAFVTSDRTGENYWGRLELSSHVYDASTKAANTWGGFQGASHFLFSFFSVPLFFPFHSAFKELNCIYVALDSLLPLVV
jgi:hypothetical protein